VGDVSEIRDNRLSVSQIADEFGMARATVAKRIEALGIRPEGKRLGYPVYRMRDIVRISGDAEPGDENDPLRMRPTDRRAWFQSENERLKFEQEQGLLIPAGEVEAEMAHIAKIVTRALATMPDRIERDMRLPAAVVEYISEQCRSIRAEIAAEMSLEDLDARVSA
jgi:phage terminase Nu1 subunit (DNA packaging protein)